MTDINAGDKNSQKHESSVNFEEVAKSLGTEANGCRSESRWFLTGAIAVSIPLFFALASLGDLTGSLTSDQKPSEEINHLVVMPKVNPGLSPMNHQGSEKNNAVTVIPSARERFLE